MVSGKIVDYAIEAPTDRIFKDARQLSQSLEGVKWTSFDAMQQSVNLAVLGLDPCVPYQLEWMEAVTHA